MWFRTFFGVILGLLLTMSIGTMIGNIVTIHRDIFLFITYVGGFLLWVSFLTWIYLQVTLKRAIATSLAVLGITSGVNALFFFKVLT